MYQIGQNLYDDPNSDGFAEAVRISVRPVITFPFERDQTARTFVDTYVQQYDSFEATAVGTPHPYLKKLVSGTVAVENNSDLVTGTSTEFLTDFLPKDLIWINGVSYKIESVSSNTELTLEDLYSEVTASGLVIYRAECYLTSESGFSYLENGLMEYNRNYASLPETRIEWGTVGFRFPAYRVQSTDTDNPIRKGFNQIVVAKNTFSYLRTNDPASEMTILPMFEPLDAVDNVVDFVATDTTPTKTVYEGYVTAETYIRSAETKIDPWMGNIWQLHNIEVIAK